MNKIEIKEALKILIMAEEVLLDLPDNLIIAMAEKRFDDVCTLDVANKLALAINFLEDELKND